jgi:hypothetical protein
VQYRGREVHFAVERNFQPLVVTLMNDTTFGVRNALEAWQGGIQEYSLTTGRITPSEYQVDMAVYQLDRNGAILKQYDFKDAYPTTISTIQLSYDQPNTIEEFEVEFVYNYFTSTTGISSNPYGVSGAINTPIGSFPLPS